MKKKLVMCPIGTSIENPAKICAFALYLKDSYSTNVVDENNDKIPGVKGLNKHKHIVKINGWILDAARAMFLLGEKGVDEEIKKINDFYSKKIYDDVFTVYPYFKTEGPTIVGSEVFLLTIFLENGETDYLLMGRDGQEIKTSLVKSE